MTRTNEQEIRRLRWTRPWRFRFGLRAYGRHRFAAMLPVIAQRLGPDTALVAKSLDPDPLGLEFTGVFGLAPGRTPRPTRRFPTLTFGRRVRG